MKMNTIILLEILAGATGLIIGRIIGLWIFDRERLKTFFRNVFHRIKKILSLRR